MWANGITIHLPIKEEEKRCPEIWKKLDCSIRRSKVAKEKLIAPFAAQVLAHVSKKASWMLPIPIESPTIRSIMGLSECTHSGISVGRLASSSGIGKREFLKGRRQSQCLNFKKLYHC